jgi:hypothetical protein
MVSGVVLVVVFPKEEDGFCASNDANSFCACTPVILVASKRIIRNNSEDETTAKNVIVRPFVVLREFVVIILSLLNNARVIFDGESSLLVLVVFLFLNPTYGNKP